jgi:Flp pilus assembly protein TadD
MRACAEGDRAGGEFLLHQALLRAQGLKSPVLEAKILNNLGLIVSMSGRRDDAVRYLQTALDKITASIGSNNKLHRVVAGNLIQAERVNQTC